MSWIFYQLIFTSDWSIDQVFILRFFKVKSRVASVHLQLNNLQLFPMHLRHWKRITYRNCDNSWFQVKIHDQSFYWRPNWESIVNCSFIRSEHQSPTSIVHKEPFYERYRWCYSRLQKWTSMSRNVPHSDDRRDIDVLLQYRPTAAGTQATGCRVF